MKIDNSLALMQGAKKLDINVHADEAKLKEQTDAFEGFLIKTMLDISLKHDNSLFPKDPGDKIYNSMYNEHMSEALSGGFGYSELLFNFLKENR